MWWIAAAMATPAYTIDLTEPNAHRIQIEAEFDGDQSTLMMPVWTPGSYLVREFARQIEWINASDKDGQPLNVTKTSKNRWIVDNAGERYTLRYGLYAAELTVRTNFVDADFAMLNGASTFVVPVDYDGGYEVDVKLPKRWKELHCQLADSGKRSFVADDLDALIDSPIVAGKPWVNRFDVDGIEHKLITLPAVEPWDNDKAAKAVKKIAQVQRDFWGQLPYTRYLYLNVISEGYGGLEHMDSTLMVTGSQNTVDDKKFKTWLGLVSHEQFHAWNVKRMRPDTLGPFDYENETYTRSLWVAEGLTSYYDDLLLARAGLLSETEYLERLNKSIRGIESAPGHLVQSMSDASFDAWVKYYRRDENSINHTISYYTKGSILGLMLDAKIRNSTKSKRSLDDVMRMVYTRHAEKGYTPADFRAAASEVAGVDLSSWFSDNVDEATELDLDEVASLYGLVVEEESDKTPVVGVGMNGDYVNHVLAKGAGFKAGINAGDEILAVDKRRFSSWSDALKGKKPDDEVTVLLSRRGQVRKISLMLGAKDPVRTLAVDEKAKKSAIKRRAAWLGL